MTQPGILDDNNANEREVGMLPSTRDAPMMTYGDPTAPAWFGRRAPATDWPAPFIRAICTPRADGGRSLTPPAGEPGDSPVREALGGLAGLAGLACLLWWALR